MDTSEVRGNSGVLFEERVDKEERVPRVGLSLEEVLKRKKGWMKRWKEV